MLINDVGEQTWEEVNEGQRGANYGWPNSEGPTTAQGVTAPLYAYDHSAGCAISGGAFHNLKRPQFPHQYWGTYFIGDYCSGWIRSITRAMAPSRSSRLEFPASSIWRRPAMAACITWRGRGNRHGHRLPDFLHRHNAARRSHRKRQ
jgi:hypothetical protein